MKKILFILLIGSISFAVAAQGNNGHNKSKSKGNTSITQSDNSRNNRGKGKEKNKDEFDKYKHEKAPNDAHDKKVWDGIGDKSCMKPSKNQPAKVREAFQRDYPNALNVRWTKCRGDWTATFDRALFRSTAVYHANGERKDTRTPVGEKDIPGRVLEEILKRRPDSRLDETIKIEVPNSVKEIFRIKNISDGKAQFEYYDADGIKVAYNY